MRDYVSSLSGMGATLILDPPVADLLNDVQGFTTKAMLGDRLSQNGEQTAVSYWGNSIVSSMILENAQGGALMNLSVTRRKRAGPSGSCAFAFL